MPLCWHGSRSNRESRAMRSATLYLDPSFSSSAMTQSLLEYEEELVCCTGLQGDAVGENAIESCSRNRRANLMYIVHFA